MDKAIEFMREINRKREVIKTCDSQHLRRDYIKSVNRDVKDLKFFCICHNISYSDVVRSAKC